MLLAQNECEYGRFDCIDEKTCALLPFVDALQSSSGHLVPIRRVFLAFLKEISNLVARLLAIKWIYMKSRNLIDDDLCRASLICCKGWQPTVHCLNDGKSKSFVESRLKDK